MKNNQRGAALIYVLVVLLVITVVGTLAIRQGVFSLKVVSNTQIQALLDQSTNATISRIQSPAFLDSYKQSAGLLGFIAEPENSDKELVFCFSDSETGFFDINTGSVVYVPEGGNVIKNDLFGTDGYCNPDSSRTNFFTSNRKTVMTQVTIKQMTTDTTDAPMSNILQGSDLPGEKLDEASALKVFVVSLMPSVSDASNEDIYQCLSTKMNEPPQGAEQTTVSDCLSNLNVPYNTQVVSYKYAPIYLP